MKNGLSAHGFPSPHDDPQNLPEAFSRQLFQNGVVTYQARDIDAARELVETAPAMIYQRRKIHAWLDRLDGELPYASMERQGDTRTVRLDPTSFASPGAFSQGFSDFTRAHLHADELQSTLRDDRSRARFINERFSPWFRRKVEESDEAKREEMVKGRVGEFVLQRLLARFSSQLRHHGAIARLLDKSRGDVALPNGHVLEAISSHNFTLKTPERDPDCPYTEFDAVVAVGSHRSPNQTLYLFDAKTGPGGGEKSQQHLNWSTIRPAIAEWLHKICVGITGHFFSSELNRSGDLHTVKLRLGHILKSSVQLILEEIMQALRGKHSAAR